MPRPTGRRRWSPRPRRSRGTPPRSVRRGTRSSRTPGGGRRPRRPRGGQTDVVSAPPPAPLPAGYSAARSSRGGHWCAPSSRAVVSKPGRNVIRSVWLYSVGFGRSGCSLLAGVRGPRPSPARGRSGGHAPPTGPGARPVRLDVEPSSAPQAVVLLGHPARVPPHGTPRPPVTEEPAAERAQAGRPGRRCTRQWHVRSDREPWCV